MSIVQRDNAPMTPGERVIYEAMPREQRSLWCPLKGTGGQFIDRLVCSRLQPDYHRKCFTARGGDICQHLDASWAEELQMARKEAKP